VAEVLHEPVAALVVIAAVMLTAVPRAARADIPVMVAEEPLTVAALTGNRAPVVLAAVDLLVVLIGRKVAVGV
jgi:hypothetical protein